MDPSMMQGMGGGGMPGMGGMGGGMPGMGGMGGGMPGMGGGAGGMDMASMMAQMGGEGGIAELLKQMTGNKKGKFDKGAFTKHMNSNNTRQRLLKKLEEKRNAEIAQSIREKLNAEKAAKTNTNTNTNTVDPENTIDESWIEEFNEKSTNSNNNGNGNKKKGKKKRGKK